MRTMQGTYSFRVLAKSLFVGSALAAATDPYTTLTSTTTVATSTTTVTLTLSKIASTSVSAATHSTIDPPTQARLLASSTFTTTSALPSSTMGSSFQSEVLNSTNWYRAQHEAAPLTWNSTLADYAQNYAKRCVWKHSGGAYGENLAANFANSTLAIDAWGKEEHSYSYKDGKFTEEDGHFTQLVWQNTTQVGCGLVQCDNDAHAGVKGAYLVCEYSPRGNVDGQFKYNVDKPGMEDDGTLGLGGASNMHDGAREMVVTLVVVYVIFALCFLC
ncbi:hypothetical protein AC579_2144 [Pseudocercospora musae]|uniref:SCP domain-containing protein n=1 Tax=Pseudocercospora musae TaxID=113226 RepID=A0A139IEG3_9PEZI|nr:hypothetical protein AC579_2144 [Pseudocercospora musae]